MFELKNHKELEKILNEVKGDKLALMRNGITLAVFDTDVDATDIECKACEIARKTLRAENIDLVAIDEKNIIKMLQKDIIEEGLEHYQVIGDHIYELDGEEEVKEELMKYAKDVFLDMLYRSDAYFEIKYDIQLYNNLIYHIFEELAKLYNEGYTISTSNNSFVLYGSYRDVITQNFKGRENVLNKKTKKNIVNEIKSSDLSKAAKKEIISRVKTY